MSTAPTQAYPLTWPAGVLRTPPHERVAGTFDSTPDRVRREMLLELDRLVLGKQARTHTVRNSVILSTNVQLRLDGEPMAGRSEPSDPGVALYFKMHGEPMVIASDKYDKVWKNMRAIQRTLEAMRAIGRYGSSQLQARAFTGFKALSQEASRPSWQAVLDVKPDCTYEQAKAAWRALVTRYHPDNNVLGDRARFEAVMVAWGEAQQHFGKA